MELGLDKRFSLVNEMDEKRYGHTRLQKKIIEYGIKGKLTAGKILEFYGSENVRSATDEINKLIFLGLVKIDKETSDEKGTIFENTRLLWNYNDDEELPYDPGEALHDPITDSWQEIWRESKAQFFHCHYNNMCQRCGKKNQHDRKYIGMDCIDSDEDGEKIWISFPKDTIVICRECYIDLIKWVNIPIMDYIP